ncbi:MAG: hypothetical protein HYR63_03470 [Proteobacteria bacterium]|nr:hypothetical protein [Pseudomonadota bacterium]
MAARYVMDREEALRLLKGCTLLWHGDEFDGRTEVLRFPKTGGPEAMAMVEEAEATGQRMIACWSKPENGFVGVAELKSLEGKRVEAYGDLKKPAGLPVTPVARFASTSLAKAFPKADETKWKAAQKRGGCRLSAIPRPEKSWTPEAPFDPWASKDGEPEQARPPRAPLDPWAPKDGEPAKARSPAAPLDPWAPKDDKPTKR